MTLAFSEALNSGWTNQAIATQSSSHLLAPFVQHVTADADESGLRAFIIAAASPRLRLPTRATCAPPLSVSSLTHSRTSNVCFQQQQAGLASETYLVGNVPCSTHFPPPGPGGPSRVFSTLGSKFRNRVARVLEQMSQARCMPGHLRLGPPKLA